MIQNLPLNIPLDEFIRPFFDVGETVCIRVFDDKKLGTFQGQKLECAAGKINSIEGTLHRHNEQNRGIYFVINFGGHLDTEITRINAQFVEVDDLTIDEQLAQLNSFPIEPSIVVRTKKSLHVYWLMQKNAKLERFRHIQKQLVAQFHGDPMCVNESRVFRLPGFNHCKGEPYPVTCIKFNPELRYSQEQLSMHLPTLPDEEQPPLNNTSAAKGDRKGIALAGKRCLFLQHCKNNAASLTEHDWYSMVSNLAVFDGGDAVIHALSKPYPKYKYKETQEKIQHFLESGTKPINCTTIAEKGFKCPKLADGSCICKSPAAMSFQPLSVDFLREMIQEQEVQPTVVGNVQTAQKFIQDYMYNIEPTIGAAFITTELCEYFNLKTGNVKPLATMQGELYKAYRNHSATRKEAAKLKLPEWYELTDKGGVHFIPGLLADHMVKNLNVFYGAGCYYFYENGVYKQENDLTASAKVREHMIPRYANMSAINDTTGQWRMLIQKDIREINSNPFIINLRNGLYNILDGGLKEHTPDYYSTVQISANYDPNARCPKFLEFLQGILTDEVPLIQEILGYILVPINKAQKAFVFVGAENAGKSTLLSVAQEILLGENNVSNITWQSISDRFKTAELFGKLANIFADLPSKSIDDNGMFKALTGEDYITAERKNKDPFSFKPFARMLFSCNEMPRNYGDRSGGFYRRLTVIKFDKSVPSERRDPNLREKLAAERDGIFMWALDGLKRLIKNNYQFTETERTREELQRYKIENNSALLFADECCTLEKDAECARNELFDSYRDYCIKNGMKNMSQITFNQELEKLGIERGRDNISRRHVWKGLRYNEE